MTVVSILNRSVLYITIIARHIKFRASTKRKEQISNGNVRDIKVITGHVATTNHQKVNAGQLLRVDFVCPCRSLHRRPASFNLLSSSPVWFGVCRRVLGTWKSWELGFIAGSRRRSWEFRLARRSSRLLKSIVKLPAILPRTARIIPSASTPTTSSTAITAMASLVVPWILIRTTIVKVPSSITRDTTVHTAPETTLPASRIIVFLLLGSIPLPSVQGIHFPLSITLSLRVHHTTVRALLAAFLIGYFLAFEEGCLVCFCAGVSGG